MGYGYGEASMASLDVVLGEGESCVVNGREDKGARHSRLVVWRGRIKRAD